MKTPILLLMSTLLTITVQAQLVTVKDTISNNIDLKLPQDKFKKRRVSGIVTSLAGCVFFGIGAATYSDGKILKEDRFYPQTAKRLTNIGKGIMFISGATIATGISITLTGFKKR